MVLPEYLHFSDHPAEVLNRLVSGWKPDRLAVLVDENTRRDCLPLLPVDAPVIEVQSGEENKHLQSCEQIWRQMTDLGFTRKSLLINLGGGVIGDMGGFAAATFKRGIRFVNFPTTLLSMVDASIGGKLGVDFQGLKNHIGVFQEPNAVVISPAFLYTLPPHEVLSGFAEVLKHGLIYDRGYWDKTKKLDPLNADWSEIIRESVGIKQAVVQADPLEAGLRKILNFGHTLGHAIESFFLGSEHRLLHGEAIAVGMIVEGFLSVRRGLLSREDQEDICSVIGQHYTLPALPALDALAVWLQQDKKNEGEEMNFSLIGPIGKAHYDEAVSLGEIRLALEDYHRIR